MNKISNKKFIFLFLIVCLLCFLYLGSRGTLASYESELEDEINTTVAGIKILINDKDVTSGEMDTNIILDNITWENTHTREGKISPGSNGVIHLNVNPTGSEVAIMYEFQFVDKTSDDSKLINFGTITSDIALTRTGVDTYTGIFTLDDLEKLKKNNISIEFYFDDSEDIEGITEDNQVLDDLFEIHFHAVQYNGEAIIPYTG